jgi:TRAP-type uncharacterized transport system fused permease subunit
LRFPAYAIYANALSNTQEFYRNTTFLSGILILGFILFPVSHRHATSKFNRWDYLFIILTLVSYGYFYASYLDLHVVRKSIPNTTDYVMAVIGIGVLFEAARRTTGYFIPGLATFAIVYALFGQYFMGIFGHGGFSFERLLYRLFMTSEGIFGITLSTASTAIVVFILFGAFLSVSGATALFNDLGAGDGRSASRRPGAGRGDLLGADRLPERQRRWLTSPPPALHHPADEKHRPVAPLCRCG